MNIPPVPVAAAVIMALLALALAIYYLLTRNRAVSGPKQEEDRAPSQPAKGSVCPLCGTGLLPGERIHSFRYPGADYDTMHIFGCPWCWKDHPARREGNPKPRKCPSCSSRLGDRDHLFAKVFRKPGRDHVSVVGCTLCR